MTAATRQGALGGLRLVLLAAGAVLAAVGPATAQIYRCDRASHPTYQNAPCADTATARTVDTTNAAVGVGVVDFGALAALRERERAADAERRAAQTAQQARAATEAAQAARAAQLRAQREQAAALAAIAEELRLARLDGVGSPRYVGGWNRPPHLRPLPRRN